MSRYRALEDGTIEYKGPGKPLIIDLDAARYMLADVRQFAAKARTSLSANGYTAWADDLEAAISVARGGLHVGQYQTGV